MVRSYLAPAVNLRIIVKQDIQSINNHFINHNAQLFNFQIGKAAKLEKADILEMTVDFVKRTQISAKSMCLQDC